MSPSNRALWLQAKQANDMVLGDAPYPSLAANELIIKTKSVAMNPADNVIQKGGLLLTQYPAILGCDAAGIVDEVGSDLSSRFQKGDHVIGQAGPLQDYKHSAFQEYVVLKYPMLAKIPTNIDFKDAVVLPLGMTTAASCLFEKELLGLALPPNEAGKGKTLLIWGASSSVGCCGVQLATAAGYDVVAIASERNHDLVKSVGAAECFDYRDPNLVATMVDALKGRDIVGAFDAISGKESLEALCEILDQSGGRKFIGSIMPGAEANAKLGITIKHNLAEDIVNSGVGAHIWHDFMEPALAEGKLHFKPSAEIVGHGFEYVQQALNTLAEGVSAKKLVVTV